MYLFQHRKNRENSLSLSFSGEQIAMRQIVAPHKKTAYLKYAVFLFRKITFTLLFNYDYGLKAKFGGHSF